MTSRGQVLLPAPVRYGPAASQGGPARPLALAGVSLPLPVTLEGDEQAEMPLLSPLPMEQENDSQ